jgi:hypothetical protein
MYKFTAALASLRVQFGHFELLLINILLILVLGKEVALQQGRK